jgi:ribonuclease D
MSGDLPDYWLGRFLSSGLVAVDTEYKTRAIDDFTFTGIRIATVQLYSKQCGCIIVRINPRIVPKNIVRLMSEASVCKVFHHAYGDLVPMAYYWGFVPANIKDTKLAAKIYDQDKAKSNSLAPLLSRFVRVNIPKEEQLSDWFRKRLTRKQVQYAARDVIYLLKLMEWIECCMPVKSGDLLGLFKLNCQAIPAMVMNKALGYDEIYPNPLYVY